jgi:hypothetical protein
MEFYRQVITKRINPDLMEEGVLDYAIRSTGKLSEFMEVMRESSLKAFRMGRKRISRDDVEASLDKLRMTYDRTLTEAHKRKLLDIH